MYFQLVWIISHQHENILWPLNEKQTEAMQELGDCFSLYSLHTCEVKAAWLIVSKARFKLDRKDESNISVQVTFSFHLMG